MIIGTLGPSGSFSEKAAKVYLKEKSVEGEIKFFRYISDIFDALMKGQIDKAIVPVENSVQGSVRETLDCLYEFDVWVEEEIILPIKHYLAAKSNSFKIIASHPQALAQCRKFIRENYPNVSLKETSSTSEAMKLASENSEIAAIGSKEAVEKFGLNIIAENIGPENNETMFLVVRRTNGKEEVGENGNYKTSIAIHPSRDRPGLLLDLLYPFKKYEINLTKIESRPTKRKIGEYIFYVDFEGNLEDEKVKKALEEVKKLAEVKILGSYIVEEEDNTSVKS